MNVLTTELPIIKHITTNERVDFYLNGHKVLFTLPNVRKDLDNYIKLVEAISLLDKPVKGRDRLKFTEAHKEFLKYSVSISDNTSDNTSGFDNIRGKLMYQDVLGLKIIVS
jgi:hypothetical protein